VLVLEGPLATIRLAAMVRQIRSLRWQTAGNQRGPKAHRAEVCAATDSR
jgi:hypothetical protein